jgi:hypothetical protein
MTTGSTVLSHLSFQRDPLARLPWREGAREMSPPQRFEGGEEAYHATARRRAGHSGAVSQRLPADEHGRALKYRSSSHAPGGANDLKIIVSLRVVNES